MVFKFDLGWTDPTRFFGLVFNRFCLTLSKTVHLLTLKSVGKTIHLLTLIKSVGKTIHLLTLIKKCR